MHALDWSSCFEDLAVVRCAAMWFREAGVYTYPPLYHLVAGSFLLVVTRPETAGVLANLVFLGLLIYSVAEIGRKAFDAATGVTAAALASIFPMAAQFQHEAFIDFALMGITAFCVWRLLETDGFQRRRASVALGLCVGLGLLLKQMLPLYLLGPVAVVLWTSRRRFGRTMLSNIGLSIAAALLVALPWYGLHWGAVLATARFNQQVASVEGDPMPWTVPGALFYIYAAASDQVGFAPFLLTIGAALYAAGRMIVKREQDASRRQFQAAVLWWILGGLGLLTFAILNKDTRYSMPVLPALALITASPVFWLRARVLRLAFLGVLALCSLPYYTHVMFSWPPFHRTIVFQTGSVWWVAWHGDYYYGSSPRAEDWSVPEMLFRMLAEKPDAAIENPIRLGLAPFLLRLNPNSVRLESIRSNIAVDVRAVGGIDLSADGEQGLLSSDFVFTKSGDTGLPFATGGTGRIDSFIAENPHTFELVETYPLPDGSIGSLFKVIDR